MTGAGDDVCRWCLRADCPSFLIARHRLRTLYSEWSAAIDDCVAHRDQRAGHDPGDEHETNSAEVTT